MAYLIAKLALVTLLVLATHSQNPDPSWDDYQVKACCPEQYIEVKTYCAKCTAPNVFDPSTQLCTPCPFDHTYNP